MIPVEGGAPIASHTVKLGKNGRAQEIFTLPKLKEGEYIVEYVMGSLRYRSPKTFSRHYYPWEGCSLGITHEVYPPFTPVKVQGKAVNIIGRTYIMNGFGLCDSMRSMGHELMAGPMRIVYQTKEGQGSWTNFNVKGRVEYSDLAVFESIAEAGPVVITSRTCVEEDGCAKVELTLKPGKKPAEITRMWLEISLKDSEMPLFHANSDNTMRNSYGGFTPRGAKIVWDLKSQMRFPPVWSADPGSEGGVIWDATQLKVWDTKDLRPYAPYIWLGGAERGFAWFCDDELGYVTDKKSPIQVISREGDKIVLRVYLIQTPVTLTAKRTLVFGMQVSPTKPMDPDWRTRPLTTGVGPVVCWGGYVCASKYPDNHDFSIVDKIQEARRSGKVDTAWFNKRDKHRVWPERQMFDEPKGNSWLWLVQLFASRAGSSKGQAGSIYFEEHYLDTRTEEWPVYQDEWANREFNRFQPDLPFYQYTGAFIPSRENFSIYYANEWMKRGVGLYFDNTFPKRSYHPRFSNAQRRSDGAMQYTIQMWAPRNYYKRLWKLRCELNKQGMPWFLDITQHMTSTRILPWNTWASTTLDLEQRYRKDDTGVMIPWPPEYTRAVTMGLQTGTMPHVLDPLHNGVRGEWYPNASQHDLLANWGMGRVHEVRGHQLSGANVALATKYDKVFTDFGYGMPEVEVHNYWADSPYITMSNPKITWLAMVRKKPPQGLLLLQSFEKATATTTIRFQKKTMLMDTETGEIFSADAGGQVTISLPADYGTRMLLIGNSREDLPDKPLVNPLIP